MKIKKYTNQVTDIQIASKPHHTAELVKDFNDEIAVAIKKDIPIRSYEENKFMNRLLDIITMLALNLGNEVDESELTVITNGVARMLVNRYKSMTLNEVELAFENGIMGKYGKSYGFSVAVCMQFIFAYSQERQKYLANANTQRDILRINKMYEK